MEDAAAASGSPDLLCRMPGATLLAAPFWQKRAGDRIDLRLPEGEAAGGHLSALTPEGWPLFTRPGQDDALRPRFLDRQLRNGEAQRTARVRSLHGGRGGPRGKPPA
ncbi:MAG: hypothetical protein IPJ99_01105 [Betaproteobacteria bacterium]|nr:hypothetical protein [Betaproteobacteria bacterium]